MGKGFFPPTAWTKQQEPQSLLPECGTCGLSKGCKSPFMKPSGNGRRRALLIAEAPGEHEDDKGVQLVGNAGHEILSILNNLGVDMREDCWLTNSLICRPTEGGHNRKPTNDEIRWCRPNLANTLKALKPDVIIPMGECALKSLIPLAWKEGEVDDVGSWVKWTIPSIKLNAWICPTYHPSFLLRLDDSPVGRLLVTKHLREAFRINGKPWKEIPDYRKNVDVELNPNKAAKTVRYLTSLKEPLAFDFETTCLKPDGPNAKILCCSVSNDSYSVAFPWEGPAIESVRELVVSDVPKIAANIRFEERWCRKHLKTAVRNWHWCTVVGAHWLTCHGGVSSLKFQAFVRLGMPDYDSHLDAYKKGTDEKDANSPNRLHEVEPKELLMYCGLDSLLEVMVAQKHIAEAYK